MTKQKYHGQLMISAKAGAATTNPHCAYKERKRNQYNKMQGKILQMGKVIFLFYVSK